MLPPHILLKKEGSPIQVGIRYSNKAKRLIIKINHKGAEIVLPNYNLNAACKFLLEKEAWIRKKLQNFSQATLPDPSIIHILGEKYSLQNIEARYNKVEVQQNIIQIYSTSPNHDYILIKLLQDKLLMEVTKSAITLSRKYNLKFNRIKITNNRNKWGSCSSAAILSFNWRLIFAPREIVEYVVVHEICHLAEMNHSRRFWNLVLKIYPNYKEAKLWLKQHGYLLSMYTR